MPTYVYECSSCSKTFEIEQRITEDALTHCIVCETGMVKRVIQPVGISFKGSGFYVNDSNSNQSSPKLESVKGESAPVAEPSTTPTSVPETPTVAKTE